MKLNKYIQWLRMLGIILFIWIVTQVNWFDVLTLLSNIKIKYVLGYFLIFLLAVFLKIMRLKWVLEKVGFPASFQSAYHFVVEPAFYGMITPARIGEFSKIIYLNNHGLPHKLAWTLVLFERLVDLSVLLIAVIFGGVYFFANQKYVYISLGAAVAFFLFFGFIFYNLIPMLIQHASFFSRRLADLFISSKKDGEVFNFSKKLPVITLILFSSSIVIIILSFTQLSLLALSLGSNVSGFYLSMAYTISSISALLPISIGGLGTREAIFMGILSKDGVDTSIALAISLLDGLVFAFIFIAILFIPILFLRTINLKVIDRNL